VICYYFLLSVASRHYTEIHSIDFMLGISTRSRFQARKYFCYLHNKPTSSGLPILPFKRYHGLFLLVSSCRGVKLTTRLHSVQMSRVSGATPPLPYTPSWHTKRQVSLCIQWLRNLRIYDGQICLVKDCGMGLRSTIY